MFQAICFQLPGKTDRVGIHEFQLTSGLADSEVAPHRGGQYVAWAFAAQRQSLAQQVGHLAGAAHARRLDPAEGGEADEDQGHRQRQDEQPVHFRAHCPDGVRIQQQLESGEQQDAMQQVNAVSQFAQHPRTDARQHAEQIVACGNQHKDHREQGQRLSPIGSGIVGDRHVAAAEYEQREHAFPGVAAKGFAAHQHACDHAAEEGLGNLQFQVPCRNSGDTGGAQAQVERGNASAKQQRQRRQRKIKEPFIDQRPGHTRGDQGAWHCVDVRAARDGKAQPTGYGFGQAGSRHPQLSARGPGDEGQHDRHREQIERRQPHEAADQQLGPVYAGLSAIQDFGEKQEGGDHEEQGHAALAEMDIEARGRQIPFASMRVVIPERRVMQEYRKREIAAQAIHRDEAALGRRLAIQLAQHHAGQKGDTHRDKNGNDADWVQIHRRESFAEAGDHE